VRHLRHRRREVLPLIRDLLTAALDQKSAKKRARCKKKKRMKVWTRKTFRKALPGEKAAGSEKAESSAQEKNEKLSWDEGGVATLPS